MLNVFHKNYKILEINYKSLLKNPLSLHRPVILIFHIKYITGLLITQTHPVLGLAFVAVAKGDHWGMDSFDKK